MVGYPHLLQTFNGVLLFLAVQAVRSAGKLTAHLLLYRCDHLGDPLVPGVVVEIDQFLLDKRA